MELIDSKVMAAISAAIGAYLEEEAAAMAAQAAPATAPFATVNLWAISGRIEMMAQRRAWQMRMY